MIQYSTHHIGEQQTPVRMALFASGGHSEASLFIYPKASLVKDAVTETIQALENMHLPGGMRPVFMRWFLSDIVNQAEVIPTGYIYYDSCPVSVVGQPPLDGGKIVLWIHLKEGIRECTEYDGGRSFRMTLDDGTTEYRCTRMDFSITDDSFIQTETILDRYCRMLRQEELSLEGNCVRTWFFVRDIDTNYAGMVRARNKVFDRHGLTAGTHYIASTGIGADMPSPYRTVSLDALAISGDPAPEIHYLYAPTHMNRTSDYGVAFERGTVVDTPGKRRVYISGTASIDNRGEIVHPGDARRQLGRMSENIDALLHEAGCSRRDLIYGILYVRDPTDASDAREHMDREYPGLPCAVVLAPVCRPGWLVEMECAAVTER